MTLPRNVNGLTFVEWAAVAIPDPEARVGRRVAMVRAWDAGEDPAEWRADADAACPKCHARLRFCRDYDPACLHCDACGWCGDPA